MCKNKNEGLRCTHHAFIELQKNAARILRDERIMGSGQELTTEELDEFNDLDARRGVLTQKEKLRLGILIRIERDNSELTPTEKKAYLSNLATRDRLSADMNVGSVARGATVKKQLSVLRGNIIAQYAAENPEAVKLHQHAQTIENFLQWRKNNPDEPLSDTEARIADALYASDPEHYNKGREVLLGNNKDAPLSEDRHAELSEVVRRYNDLSPANAPEKQRAVHADIQKLRGNADAFAQLSRGDLSKEEIDALPHFHKRFYTHPRRKEIMATAVTQDRRVMLYGLLSSQASHHFPVLYKKASDREAMDAARSSLAFGPHDVSKPVLAARRRSVVESEEFLRTKKFDKFGPSDMQTIPPVDKKLANASNAELDAKAKHLGANRRAPKSAARAGYPTLAAHLDNSTQKKPVATTQKAPATQIADAPSNAVGVNSTAAVPAPTSSGVRPAVPVTPSGRDRPTVATTPATSPRSSSLVTPPPPAVKSFVAPATVNNQPVKKIESSAAAASARPAAPVRVNNKAPAAAQLPSFPSLADGRRTNSVAVPMPVVKPVVAEVQDEEDVAPETHESFFARLFKHN